MYLIIKFFDGGSIVGYFREVLWHYDVVSLKTKKKKIVSLIQAFHMNLIELLKPPTEVLERFLHSSAIKKNNLWKK